MSQTSMPCRRSSGSRSTKKGSRGASAPSWTRTATGCASPLGVPDREGLTRLSGDALGAGVVRAARDDRAAVGQADPEAQHDGLPGQPAQVDANGDDAAADPEMDLAPGEGGRRAADARVARDLDVCAEQPPAAALPCGRG